MVPLPLLLLLASAASAQTIDVTLTSGSSQFVHRVAVDSSGMSNFVGEVASKDGARRMLVANLTPSADGRVGFQLELTTLDKRDTFQIQSAVGLRPGTTLVVAQCGGYTAKLSMTGKSGLSAPENHRVTVDGRFAEDAGRCSALVASGAQFNLLSPMTLGESRKRLILNGVLNAAPGSYTLEYQLELGGATAQGTLTPAPGKKARVLAKGDLSASLSVASAARTR